jgi:hypothetical protein
MVTITGGTLIQGTLRPEDLIPAFQSELAEVDPAGYAKLLVKWGPDLQRRKVTPTWIERHPEEASELVGDLADALSEAASAQGYYFGPHEGDGADWGYWTLDEEQNEGTY